MTRRGPQLHGHTRRGLSREQRAEMVRDEIVLSMRTMLTEGRRLNQITAQDIGAGAGVSWRTVWRYYDTKADLALAACRIEDQPDRALLRRLVDEDGAMLGHLVVTLAGRQPAHVVEAAEYAAELLGVSEPHRETA